ncbi:hypothetical protein ERJ75_000136000 [Trypanosoma vivax]|nr:hypothetical protein ERJ75_000136000 [Trypanosoma vivax]
MSPPSWAPELTKLDKIVQECKNEWKRGAPIRWRRKVLADTALGRWEESAPKLSATGWASLSPAKPICAPRPMTSPVPVVDGHPPAKRQQTQALANMHMARPAKAQHAPEMKMPSARHSTFRPITEEKLDAALRELSSGKAPGDDEVLREGLKQLGSKEVRAATVQLQFVHGAGAGQVEARHHSPAAEAEQASEQHGVLSASAKALQAGSSGRAAAGAVRNRHLEAFRVASQSARTQDGPA